MSRQFGKNECFNARLCAPRGFGDVTEGLARLFPVFQERFEAAIRERMLEEHFENLVRHGADVRAHFRRFDDVQRMAQARGEHLRLVVVGAINFAGFREVGRGRPAKCRRGGRGTG